MRHIENEKYIFHDTQYPAKVYSVGKRTTPHFFFFFLGVGGCCCCCCCLRGLSHFIYYPVLFSLSASHSLLHRIEPLLYCCCCCCCYSSVLLLLFLPLSFFSGNSVFCLAVAAAVKVRFSPFYLLPVQCLTWVWKEQEQTLLKLTGRW